MSSRAPRDATRKPAEPRKPTLFDRGREVGRVRETIERLESPRLQMMFIVALTGATGFFASYVMLIAGLHAMWLRYPLAVAVAYLAFLGLLWLWLRAIDRGHERNDALDSDAADLAVDTSDVFLRSTPDGDGAGSGPDFDLDVGGADLDEGAPIALAIALVVAAVVAVAAAFWAVFAIVGGAPVLLAELAVDAALARGLYLRVRAIDRNRHWLRTAVARTVWRFAAVAGVFGAIGALLAWLVPGADSIGDIHG